jgi:FMN-dependent oxidoreductase (nitrilotriacetate monooxygenase family)
VAAKQIHLNAFEMNCVGHLARGMWRHPADTRYRYTDLDYWNEEARLLEAGCFDALFLADVLGTYERAPGDSADALRLAHQVPVNDPLLLVPALAQVTSQLGFAVTVSATYEPPFAHARRMSTVDHLTKGRIGWNVVTSYLDNAARNFGLDGQIAHDERYERAEEYLEVCYQLWEGSWEDGAVLRDRTRGIFTDPAKVHYIDHAGKYFRVAGPHLSEPSPQRTPVVFQATGSPRGKLFAGKHAEAVFLASSSLEKVTADIAEIRKLAVEHGRAPDDVKIFNHFRFIVGRTRGEAEAKAEEYARFRSVESRFYGLDLARYDPDTLLQDVELPADDSGRGPGRYLGQFIEEWAGRPTVRDLLATIRRNGGVDPFAVVGTPEEIAGKIEEYVARTDLDGFNVHSNVSLESYRDFVELVVPVLQARGLFRSRYDPAETTLRERLFGAGRKRLRDTHPGAAYRLASALTPASGRSGG